MVRKIEIPDTKNVPYFYVLKKDYAPILKWKHTQGVGNCFTSIQLAYLEELESWTPNPPWLSSVGLVPDAYFNLNKRCFYLEYDSGSETKGKIEEKLAKYYKYMQDNPHQLIYVLFVFDNYFSQGKLIKHEETRKKWALKLFKEIGLHPFYFLATTMSAISSLPIEKGKIITTYLGKDLALTDLRQYMKTQN